MPLSVLAKCRDYHTDGKCDDTGGSNFVVGKHEVELRWKDMMASCCKYECSGTSDKCKTAYQKSISICWERGCNGDDSYVIPYF